MTNDSALSSIAAKTDTDKRFLWTSVVVGCVFSVCSLCNLKNSKATNVAILHNVVQHKSFVISAC